MAGSEISGIKLKRGFLSTELPSSGFDKESRKNAWVDANSVLGYAVTTGGEGHGFSDSPNHSIFSSAVCLEYQGADSVVTQREESNLFDSPSLNIFLQGSQTGHATWEPIPFLGNRISDLNLNGRYI